jgi:hypothetical protein
MNNDIGDEDIVTLFVVVGAYRSFGCLRGIGFREGILGSERKHDLHYQS